MSALLAPIIAIAVAFIAYQQWKTNHRREERESRSDRLAIYRRTKALLRHVDYTREIRKDLYDDFCEASAEADFLFPISLAEWLEELESSAAQWLDWHEDMSSVAADADQNSIARVSRDMEKIIDSLQDAHCVLKEKFAEHMK
ncbi:MAG: hypothetical protein CVV05_14265 [Gammaproteobacteria bacterium HGW-Gammaproteobacteria-1]|nr:MAG: hypothetical protein CVV05_14265 [Gammaproteobacteria bacterium HGW-Gammaproteobacteria-1]